MSAHPLPYWRRIPSADAATVAVDSGWTLIGLPRQPTVADPAAVPPIVLESAPGSRRIPADELGIAAVPPALVPM